MMEKFKSPPCSANVRGELPEVHYPGCIAPVASSVMFGLCSLIFKSPETAIKINLSKGVRLSKGNFRQLCLNLCLELPALKDSCRIRRAALIGLIHRIQRLPLVEFLTI